MLLETPNLIITPFESVDDAGVSSLIRWYYDKKYTNFFRHQPRPWRIDEFRNYPKMVNSEIFFIKDKKTANHIGIIQISGDCKTNRAFYIGLLIDEEHQKNRYPLEAFISIFDYCFNRLGYRKAIIEIVEGHTSLQRIISENGFVFEGTLQDECFLDGKFVNESRYCMFDIDYNNRFKPILKKWEQDGWNT